MPMASKRAHFGSGDRLLIEEGSNDAADTADIHDARNAEVQVAGFFGEDFTGAAVQKRNALHDGTRKERSKIKHLLRLLFALAQTDLVGEEELTADDEEQDDTGQNVGEGMVEGEYAGNLTRAAA